LFGRSRRAIAQSSLDAAALGGERGELALEELVHGTSELVAVDALSAARELGDLASGSVDLGQEREPLPVAHE